MRVRITRTAAGPDYVYQEGLVYDVPPAHLGGLDYVLIGPVEDTRILQPAAAADGVADKGTPFDEPLQAEDSPAEDKAEKEGAVEPTRTTRPRRGGRR